MKNEHTDPVQTDQPVVDEVAKNQTSLDAIMKNLWRFVTKRTVGLCMLIVIVVLAFGSGVRYGQQHSPSAYPGVVSSSNVKNRTPPADIASQVNFSEFWEVWDLVSQSYYDKTKVNGQQMMYGAIKGMVASLGDPYTTFLTPDENKATQDELGGNFSGVGLELGYKDNNLVVMSVLDDTPAKKAGILAGDYITKIDGLTTQGITLPDAVNKIRGNQGTQVKLELVRTGDVQPIEDTLTRDEIHVKSVTFTNENNGIGLIRISEFGDSTNSEWDAAVQQAQAANVKGIVLDLRDNPGGYFDSAIYIASEFVNGTIVKQESADGQKKVFTSVRQGKYLQIPLVVLINGGSASAAEILAGAMQANHRAQLVGQTSFGKGTIQEVQDLDNGSGIHITEAKWLMPNDFWVHMIGITPDVSVPITADDIKSGNDPQLNKAIQIVQGEVK